jgi:oxygen-independent coproporphyrinogen-3 oxidase
VADAPDTFGGMTASAYLNALIKKYDVPVPRYTSYPTVPAWKTKLFHSGGWEDAVRKCFDETNDSRGISVYIHLPFCESVCTYCACNTRITKNHAVEVPYSRALREEWSHYLRLFGRKPVIRELHLGGGTPTFFSPEHLRSILEPIIGSGKETSHGKFSFEGHPNNTTREHLQVLYDLGFRRVSYGVQDLDERVQRAIHRIQPAEKVESAVRMSREIGYTSVSFDLVYGLPFQTLESVRSTVKQLISLHPDRIAFYSYAHVPWLKPGQRGYEDADLPSDVEKRALYEAGRSLFLEAGYEDIGMDHFALPADALSMARKEGYLHRNFMGYTTSRSELLIGLGASAISDAKYAYAQNEKKAEEYQSMIASEGNAVVKGHLMSDEDLKIRRAILDLACLGRLQTPLLNELESAEITAQLTVFEEEGLIERSAPGIHITPAGRMFIRNICSAFDRYYTGASANVFSKAI